MIAAGEFLEWADVFGNLYGTCAADTERMLAAGDDVVLVIDVQGARKVRAPRRATTTVFVMPPSFAMLEQRLRGRSKDSEAAIQRRLQVARDEVAAFTEYDFVVINDEMTAAVNRLRSIVVAERARLRRMGSRRKHSQDIFMIDRSKLPELVRVRRHRRGAGARRDASGRSAPQLPAVA